MMPACAHMSSRILVPLTLSVSVETFDENIEGVSTQSHECLNVLHGRLLVRKNKVPSERSVLVNQHKHVRLVIPGFLGHGKQV